MAFASGLVLVVFLLLRPMELWPEVAQLHSLEVLTTITAIGIVGETFSVQRTPGASPQLVSLSAFVAWACVATVARLGLGDGLKALSGTALGPMFMVLVVLAFPQVARLRATALVLLGCCAFVSVVAIHQGAQPRECIELHELPMTGTVREVEPIPEGRECESPRQCEAEGAPESDYLCERVGLFRTMSTQGRVRWRGQLDDPNEVAVLLGALLPFMFMFASGARGLGRIFALCLLFGLATWAIVLTQSRGGQLVFGAVIVFVLVRRFGWWSALLGLAATALLVMSSWRADADAESSSLERIEILSEGLQMLKSHPILGVGVGQFAGENPLNMAAHNSYLLIAAEVGIPGYLLWCGLVWMTVKIPVAISLRPPPGLDAGLVRFAEALAVSVLGLHVGIFFLSFAYKHVFFVWLGLAGALYGAVREAHPDYRVGVTWRDVVGVCSLAAVALVIVRVVALTAR